MKDNENEEDKEFVQKEEIKIEFGNNNAQVDDKSDRLNDTLAQVA